MKPGAKKGLIVIAVLYVITVSVAVINFAYEARLQHPEQVTELIQHHLNSAREAALNVDPEKIRTGEFSQQEAARLLDMFRRQGSIININYTLIMQCLNFGILLLVLYGWFWDPMMKFLDERRRRVREKLEEADEREEEAQQLVRKRRQELSELKAERTGILEQARQTAEQQRDDVIQKARREAERITEETEERLEEEFRRARTKLREEVADLVTQVTSRLLQRELDTEDHRRYIDEMIEQMAVEPDEEARHE